MVVHKGSKSKSCPHCTYSTLSSHNLSRHIKDDHGTLISKYEIAPVPLPQNTPTNKVKMNSERTFPNKISIHNASTSDFKHIKDEFAAKDSGKEPKSKSNKQSDITYLNDVFPCPYKDCGYS